MTDDAIQTFCGSRQPHGHHDWDGPLGECQGSDLEDPLHPENGVCLCGGCVL